MCSFWLVEAMARAGIVEEAQLIFEKLLGYANHLGLFSEEVSGEGRTPRQFPAGADAPRADQCGLTQSGQAAGIVLFQWSSYFVKIVASTFMPGRSTTPSGKWSNTIFTGMRCTTFTKLPVAFSAAADSCARRWRRRSNRHGPRCSCRTYRRAPRRAVRDARARAASP